MLLMTRAILDGTLETMPEGLQNEKNKNKQKQRPGYQRKKQHQHILRSILEIWEDLLSLRLLLEITSLH